MLAVSQAQPTKKPAEIAGFVTFGRHSITLKGNLHKGVTGHLMRTTRGIRTMIENNQTQSKGRGGARKGAGRKAGSATRRTREIADKSASEGITPLEYMLEVMRRPSDHDDERVMMAREAMRFEAAKAAAPYIHPRLAAIEHSGDPDQPVEHVFRWAK